MFAVYGTTGMVAVPGIAECFRNFTTFVGGRWKGEEWPAVMFLNIPDIPLVRRGKWYLDMVKVCLLFVPEAALAFIPPSDPNRTMNAR